MAWSWSHTEQAYADAYENLQELPRTVLAEILAEWYGRGDDADDADFEGFSPSKYESERARLGDGPLPTADVLADCIWELASEQAICDNGGFNAWMCPYGCGCHCVAFDRESADTLA